MAVVYADLFEDVGEYVQRVNDFVAIIAALDADYLEIAQELETNLRFDLLEGQFDQYEQYKAQVLGWIGNLKGQIEERLLHKSTMLDELVYGSDTSFESVVGALHKAMLDDTQSIVTNTVTLGSVLLTETGSSDGLLIVDKVLDGVNAPHPGWPAVRSYKGLDSQVGLTDEMAVTCTNDSETDGLTDGFEIFQWSGRPSSGDPYSWQTFGSGDGPTLTPVQAGGILLNAEFQNFTTTNTPDDWTISTGTVGTHIFEDTTVHRGSKALKFTGNASLAAINIYQTLTTLIPNKRYFVGFYVKGVAGVSSGTLTIQFEGTGYTAGATEKIELNAAALAAQTTYEWEHFFVNMPVYIPSDFALVIKWTGTPSAHSILINGGGLIEAVYFNGHCAGITAGSAPFLRTDRFTYTVTNNYNGVFQTAFAKLFGMQMPSSGAPTQADSLAT